MDTVRASTCEVDSTDHVIAGTAVAQIAGLIAAPEDIVAFGQRWYPYGGGPAADIFVEFGCTPRRFFTELAELLTTDPPVDLSAAARTSMIAVCSRRIWLGQ